MSSTRPDSDFKPSEKTREVLSTILQRVFAQEQCLVGRLRDFGTEAVGPRGHSLLKLCDDQKQQLDYWLTQLRRYTGSIGLQLPDSGNHDVEKRASPERVGRAPATQVLQELRVQHEQLARELRTGRRDLADAASSLLLERIAEVHDTAAWMLRIVVEGPNRVLAEENYFRDAPDDSERV